MSNIGIWEDAEPGVRRRILPPGQNLMMMEVRFEKGAQGYDHSHPHEQLSYCIQGKLDFRINGETICIQAGESITIPSGAVHGVTAREASTLLDVFTPPREDLIKR